MAVEYSISVVLAQDPRHADRSADQQMTVGISTTITRDNKLVSLILSRPSLLS
jgi:hypothetical protein